MYVFLLRVGRFTHFNKTLPELYANKYKQTVGIMYKKLHEVFKEIKREAKGSDVKKQISSLRLNHRRNGLNNPL